MDGGDEREVVGWLVVGWAGLDNGYVMDTDTVYVK
jgi:hypothetical protein